MMTSTNNAPRTGTLLKRVYACWNILFFLRHGIAVVVALFVDGEEEEVGGESFVVPLFIGA